MSALTGSKTPATSPQVGALDEGSAAPREVDDFVDDAAFELLAPPEPLAWEEDDEEDDDDVFDDEDDLDLGDEDEDFFDDDEDEDDVDGDDAEPGEEE